MKKLLVLLLVGMFVSVFCQEKEPETDKKVQFGVKAGLNVAHIPEVLEEVRENDPQIGFHIGGYIAIDISDKLLLQPELFYSQQGTKTLFVFKNDTFTEGIDINGDFNIDYINIPVLLKWNVYDDFYFGGGPYLGFLVRKNVHVYTPDYVVGINIDEEGNFEEVSDRLLEAGYNFDLEPNNIDFGFVFDGSYHFNFGLHVFTRYSMGITNMIRGKEEDIEAEPKNSVFSFGVGYTF